MFSSLILTAASVNTMAFDPLLESLRHWLQHYGIMVLVLGLFGETIFFTGVFVPGSALLIVSGYLIAGRTFPLGPTIMAAWVAAICGDQGGYWLGHWWGERLLRRRKTLAIRLRALLEREGSWFLLLYHYVPYFRSVVPAVVGSMRFFYFKWLIFDSLGVFVWIVAMLTLGYTTFSWFHGAMLSRLLGAAVFLLMIYIIWRIYRDLSRRCPEDVSRKSE